jgi:hypothetical protein
VPDNWARPIQEIYKIDPPSRPKCREGMRLISVIEEPGGIRAILEHPGLRPVLLTPLPKEGSGVRKGVQ